MKTDEVWKDPDLVKRFLTGVRGAIPLADVQIHVMIRLLKAAGELKRFADLGCGNGVLSSAILEHYPEARGVLVDFSEPMLRAAREALKDRSSQLKIQQADLGDSEWKDQLMDMAPLDAVVSGFAIHHLSNDRKYELYREIFDLLSPGGLFINVEHVASRTKWINDLSDEYFIDSFYEHHQREGTGKSRDEIAHEFFHRDDKEANILVPVEDQCEWLRELGYVDVDCVLKVFEIGVFSGRKPV